MCLVLQILFGVCTEFVVRRVRDPHIINICATRSFACECAMDKRVRDSYIEFVTRIYQVRDLHSAPMCATHYFACECVTGTEVRDSENTGHFCERTFHFCIAEKHVYLCAEKYI